MTVNLSALAGAGQQFLDNNGVPLSGGKLYSYVAGTTTLQTTYVDAAGTTPHANPIILNAGGRVATGEIWVTAGQNYKFVLFTSDNVLIATWDNITGINGTGIATNAEYVTYDPPFSGGVATTVENKLAQTPSVKDFGALGNDPVVDTPAMQAAVDYIQASSTNAWVDGNSINLQLSTGVSQGSGDAGVRYLYATATDTFSSASTSEAMVQLSGLRINYDNVTLECQKLANGILRASSGFGSIYNQIEIDNFKDFGFRISAGTGGDQRLMNSLITGQADVAERTAGGVGLDIQSGDQKVINTTVRYADTPVRVSTNTNMFTGCHFYNGDALSSTPATNSKNIVFTGGTYTTFCHTYLDKGRIVFDKTNPNAAFFDTKLLFNSPPQHDSVVHMVAFEPNQPWPKDFIYDGSTSTGPLTGNNMEFVTLEDDGANTFSTEAVNVAAELNRHAGYPRVVPRESSTLVPDDRSIITLGGVQTVYHMFGTQTSSVNTGTGPREVWAPSSLTLTASGMAFTVNASGDFSTGYSTISGSRTGAGADIASQTLQNRRGSDTYDNTTGSYWKMALSGLVGTQDDLYFYSKPPGTTTETARVVLTDAGATLRPGTDNLWALGSGTFRWTTVFAATGTINTSDERRKTELLPLTEVEKTVALELKASIRKFKFLDAVEKKGDKARVHFGVGAQTVKAIFEKHGLNPDDYGLFCYDKWDATEAVLNEDGVEIAPAKPAGDIYGVRYDELLAFIIAAL